MATRGRKTKLTPELQDKIEKALSAGNYVETACAYAGISVATFYNWLNEARKDDAEPIYVEFLEATERARAVSEMRNVQIVQNAAMGDDDKDPDWRAASWFLERAFPRKWGRQERVELSGAEGGPINVNVDARKHVMDLLGLNREE